MKPRTKSKQMASRQRESGEPNLIQKIAFKWAIKKLKPERIPIVKQIWTWLNGHKTEIGGVITIISIQAPQLLEVMNIPVEAGTIGGSIIAGIGLLHKILKGIGWAEPVKYVK